MSRWHPLRRSHTAPNATAPWPTRRGPRHTTITAAMIEAAANAMVTAGEGIEDRTHQTPLRFLPAEHQSVYRRMAEAALTAALSTP